MNEFKAILCIKSSNGRGIDSYRILDEQTKQFEDFSVGKIKAAIKNGTIVKGLSVQENEIIETMVIPVIPKMRSGSIPLEEWCRQNSERGARIYKEFIDGDNFPVLPSDISSNSGLKFGFRCEKCHKINIQYVCHKTNEDSKCKYCAGKSGEISLYDWCQSQGERGERILNEYLGGNNELNPNKISYGSHKQANFKCLTCNSINSQIIKNKTGQYDNKCKHCNKKSTSYAEQLIYIFIKINGLEVYNRYKIHEKEFDIYIPVLNLLIEHQSAYHAEVDRKVNDDYGKYEANQLGLHYLEICCIDSSYQRQPSQNCIVYKYNHEDEMIRSLCLWFQQNYNISLNMNLYTRDLEDDAYLKSTEVKYENSLQARNPKLASEWNQQLNGKITPDLVSLNNTRKYYWTCKTCGNTWLAAPAWRNNGTGCPNRKNHKAFMKIQSKYRV